MKRSRGNKSIDFGDYEPTKEEREAAYWCWDNNIIVHSEIKQEEPWRVCVKMKGKTNCSPEYYGKTDVQKKVFEFYLYYYKKYGNKKTI